YNFIKEIKTEREVLLKIFAAVSAGAPDTEGADSGFVALKNDFGVTPAQAAFALEVFRQLSLLSFNEGKLTVFRGVKTELTNSELYNLVSGAK
ncbi:MAG: hypothetical protein K2N33_05305, partial [Clostridia bacterium]|nr:hypothetical protein [Clostridia bacterium]